MVISFKTWLFEKFFTHLLINLKLIFIYDYQIPPLDLKQQANIQILMYD